MNFAWFGSATGAAKKKNKLSGKTLFLTGNEGLSISKNIAAPVHSEVVPKAKTPESSVKSITTRTPSLKDTLSKISQIGKEESQANSKVDLHNSDTGLPRNAISKENIDERWGLFVDSIRNKDQRMHAALKSIVPEWEEPERIVLKFQNNALLSEFQTRLKPALLRYFKENLQNEFITIGEFVVEAEKMEKPNFLSEGEKLLKMIEKNPALQELKTKFKLDFD